VSAPVVQWLSEAERAGAWVTVISDAGEAPAGVRMHRVRRFGPLVLMRALDAERQLGPLDGVVTSGRWLGLLSRLLPSALRSYSPVLGLDESAAKLKDGH
jgi:hypothetical protein